MDLKGARRRNTERVTGGMFYSGVSGSLDMICCLTVNVYKNNLTYTVHACIPPTPHCSPIPSTGRCTEKTFFFRLPFLDAVLGYTQNQKLSFN